MRINSVFWGLGLVAVAMGCTSTHDSATQDYPLWLEPDSATAMHHRLLRDFPMTYQEGVEAIIEAYPDVSADSIRDYILRHYIETETIDGQERMFRKSVRNFGLLHPQYNEGWTHRGGSASAERISYVDSMLRYAKGTLPDGGAHKVKLRFSIDVPYADVLEDDTLRVWMPYPLTSARQDGINLISAYPGNYIISTPEQSQHRTLYMESPVVTDSTTHFEYVVEFITRGQYFSPADIKANIKPYDKSSADYQRYTAFDSPHYVRLDSLATLIVGDVTDPFQQSELVYDYIVNHYPWAGAREYSTIPCLPEYVVSEGHGDCGQVALLYISLMRTLGVPARWESGWMLHPGEKNFHDWAEVYFEGVGWVPVDVSFGRYTTSTDAAVEHFYSTGMDAHRFATNTGVGDAFFPAKRYIRSETVDSQAGEVECSKGNLFYPGWDVNLEIISITPTK